MKDAGSGGHEPALLELVCDKLRQARGFSLGVQGVVDGEAWSKDHV